MGRERVWMDPQGAASKLNIKSAAADDVSYRQSLIKIYFLLPTNLASLWKKDPLFVSQAKSRSHSIFKSTFCCITVVWGKVSVWSHKCGIKLCNTDRWLHVSAQSRWHSQTGSFHMETEESGWIIITQLQLLFTSWDPVGCRDTQTQALEKSFSLLFQQLWDHFIFHQSRRTVENTDWHLKRSTFSDALHSVATSSFVPLSHPFWTPLLSFFSHFFSRALSLLVGLVCSTLLKHVLDWSTN